MRILCSNDDGINARGLAVIEEIARQFTDDVWTVAPETDQSGAARALTLSTPLRIRKVEERRYAVSGTPGDCVQLGAGHLMPELDGGTPDLILSGVNNGQNIAEDVTVSGTVAAAFQGMTMGIPAIALSLARFDRSHCHWDSVTHHAPGVVRRLLDAGWPKDVVMNVNFPDRSAEKVGEVMVTHQGMRDHINLYNEERTDPRGFRYYWYGWNDKLSDPPEGTDIHAIYHGHISVTPLHLSLTHGDACKALRDHFEG